MKSNSNIINSWKVGKVKFFDEERGFGFIECWDDGQEYFVHISNVKTQPILLNNFVAFQLSPSRKHYGKLEAKKVSLIAKFRENHPFLKEQFAKYSDVHFRDCIIQSLPKADVITLLEDELSRFGIIDSEDQFSKCLQAIKLFWSSDSDELIDDELSMAISNKLDQISSPKYKMKFWDKGWLKSLPSDEIVKESFNDGDKEEKLRIFKRIDAPKRLELIEDYVANAEPTIVFDFVIQHIRQINELAYYADIKSRLFDSEFWENKIGHELFEHVILELERTLDDPQKLSLFLDGYLNSISLDFILEKCIRLPRENIEQILEREVLSKTEAFKVLDKILSKDIEWYWEEIPEEEFVMNASERDWEEYEERRMQPFKWVLEMSKHLTDNKISKIQDKIIEKMPEGLHVYLWESESLTDIPTSSISNYLLDYLETSKEIKSKTRDWIDSDLITREDLVQILKSNIKNQGEIKNRKDYYNLNNHLQTLKSLDEDITAIEEMVQDSNQSFYELALWLDGMSSNFNFDEYKTKLVFLSPDDQILFLRKLFWLHHTGDFQVTVGKLDQLTRIDFNLFKINEGYNSDIPLDITVDIVIKAIQSYSENEKFLMDSELLTIVLNDLHDNRKYKFKLRQLFEYCEGREEANFDWDTEGRIRKIPFGEDKFYFGISFSAGERKPDYSRRGGYDRYVRNPNFEHLKEAVKDLPGRKWNPDLQIWGVPSKFEKEVLEFANKERFFLDFPGSNYANNLHLANYERTEVPYGITFCEGRLANIKHKLHKREFWWCCNQPCFNNCETISDPDGWKGYTLLDFLIILGFDLDDGNRVGDHIERGKYYQFISTINRFNRLLDHLYCHECKHILHPVEDSHFAHYRVVRFQCENEYCREHHHEVYLHHCLNGKCNGIIDSRISKKCPNGLYICSNKNCGCCCSHSMFKRRLQNLKTTGGYIHSRLLREIEQKEGHLERAEHYCYNCGGFMDEVSKDIFKCHECIIEYDVSSNRFDRPHRHLGRNKISTTNIQPGNLDDFMPF